MVILGSCKGGGGSVLRGWLMWSLLHVCVRYAPFVMMKSFNYRLPWEGKKGYFSSDPPFDCQQDLRWEEMGNNPMRRSLRPERYKL